MLDIIPTLFVQWHRDGVIEMLLFSVCIGVVIKIGVNHPITWGVYAEYETACGCIILVFVCRFNNRLIVNQEFSCVGS